ncbi:multiple inositol polyphosphate phosphatase 1-like isoform X2 [Daktulosphaira vitifoliae]|uniref:multiple inositol polyphosphate phosphatase 1-like isoform X2 n=1 Tax=Daktulosphaira vitifoliae TaxID=58002 RepID=UPI0021AAE5F1|nr:multiple inositol polyphosphate phosphatase 1-like isoform X2 [Daktulosphaira vitifoliae]
MRIIYLTKVLLQFLIYVKGQQPCYQTMKNPPKPIFGSMSPYPNDSMIEIPEDMCQEDKDALNKWQPTLDEFEAKELNSQGKDDLKSLGKRVRKTFIELFNTSYDSSNFQILSTKKARCVYTAKYFLNALFDDIVVKDIDEIPTYENNDPRLDFSIGISSKPNDTVRWEDQVQKFKKSSHVQSVVQSVAQKMKYSDLDIEKVLVMHDACQYEKTWHLASLPAWCAFFSEKDLEVLEYLDDLHRYYFNSYGNSYNERFGCPLVKDMIENFKKKVERSEGPRGVFYFGHSSNLLSLISRLGLFKDTEPITADNFDKMKNRKFRTSSIDSFASNMIVALYKCDDGNYKVSFYENEKPVKIGGDHGCYDCLWKDLEQHLVPITSDKKCTFEDSQSNSANFSYIEFYLLLLCVYITFMK